MTTTHTYEETIGIEHSLRDLHVGDMDLCFKKIPQHELIALSRAIGTTFHKGVRIDAPTTRRRRRGSDEELYDLDNPPVITPAEVPREAQQNYVAAMEDVVANLDGNEGLQVGDIAALAEGNKEKMNAIYSTLARNMDESDGERMQRTFTAFQANNVFETRNDEDTKRRQFIRAVKTHLSTCEMNNEIEVLINDESSIYEALLVLESPLLAYINKLSSTNEENAKTKIDRLAKENIFMRGISDDAKTALEDQVKNTATFKRALNGMEESMDENRIETSNRLYLNASARIVQTAIPETRELIRWLGNIYRADTITMPVRAAIFSMLQLTNNMMINDPQNRVNDLKTHQQYNNVQNVLLGDAEDAAIDLTKKIIRQMLLAFNTGEINDPQISTGPINNNEEYIEKLFLAARNRQSGGFASSGLALHALDRLMHARPWWLVTIPSKYHCIHPLIKKKVNRLDYRQYETNFGPQDGDYMNPDELYKRTFQVFILELADNAIDTPEKLVEYVKKAGGYIFQAAENNPRLSATALVASGISAYTNILSVGLKFMTSSDIPMWAKLFALLLDPTERAIKYVTGLNLNYKGYFADQAVGWTASIATAPLRWLRNLIPFNFPNISSIYNWIKSNFFSAVWKAFFLTDPGYANIVDLEADIRLTAFIITVSLSAFAVYRLANGAIIFVLKKYTSRAYWRRPGKRQRTT